MLKASVREYTLLTKDVLNIKECITKHVSYIIGSNGIALLIFGSIRVIDGNKTNLLGDDCVVHLFASDLILITEICILLSLYYVLNYKFASHNRYVAYLQLLSQEIKHVKYDIKSSKKYALSQHDLDEGFALSDKQRVKRKIQKISFPGIMLLPNGITEPALMNILHSILES